MSFKSLDLHEVLQESIENQGYSETTEIQRVAIPEIAAGKDVVALAQTGTGKTAAYLLPILDRLIKSPVKKRRELYQKPRVLVLLPTRELASQVQQACLEYGSQMEILKSILITGGVPFHRHMSKLNSNIDIFIGTPGRALDYINRGKINFKNLDFLVLDEADRMLDMGFSQDVLKIVNASSRTAQILLFSATINSKVESLYSRFMKNPLIIKTKDAQLRNTRISQWIQYVKDVTEKSRALDKIIEDDEIEQSIIFTSTKSAAEQLAKRLAKQGHSADALHGDMQQGDRNKVIGKFKSKRLQFLVGTDILGRGIDVPEVSHVINYDMPNEPEDYVHRIGRTGRANNSGKAITLSYLKEFMQQKKIEEYLGHEIEALQLEGFTEYTKSRHQGNGAKKSSFGRRGRSTRRSSRRR